MSDGERDGGTGVRDLWRDRWLASKTSPRTRETYGAAIDEWFARLDAAGVDWRDAEPHDVDDHRNRLVARGAAPASVNRHLATVSSFYRHVLQRARPCPIPSNPVADVERLRVDTLSRRDGLTVEQARAMRAVSLAKGARTAAVVHLLLGTAVRVSEAVGAKVGGLGWSEDGVRTLSVVRKGGRPDVLEIQPGDWAVIEEYLSTRPDVPNGWLLASSGGRQMSRQRAYELVRLCADEVVGSTKKIGPHSLRHTAATLALDAGMPIQEVQGLLRHASPSTTQRYDRGHRERGRAAGRALAKALEAEDGE